MKPLLSDSSTQRVTVIIPVFNGSDTLKRAVYSALAQSETAKVVIVDDHSEDDSLNLAFKISAEFERVTVIQVNQEANAGVSVARNLGMEAVKTPFFCFLDADDYFLPHAFTKALLKLDESDCDAAYQLAEIGLEYGRQVSRTGRHPGPNPPPQPADLFDCLSKKNFSSIPPLNTFVFRSTLKNERFDEDLKMTQDTDFIWQLARKYRLCSVPDSGTTVIRVWSGHNRTANLREWARWRRRFALKWIEILKLEENSTGARRLLFKRYLDSYVFPLKIHKFAAFRIPAKAIISLGILLCRPVFWFHRLK